MSTENLAWLRGIAAWIRSPPPDAECSELRLRADRLANLAPALLAAANPEFVDALDRALEVWANGGALTEDRLREFDSALRSARKAQHALDAAIGRERGEA